ncbi:3-carboxy-cis,cis-muconate cycloisomerase [Litoreibacter roseus]|uniref:3-carboxy-cis,cis-muconate cycloisomerase n=1 Tax=Litoreibacter roseus TaxID=2601869 RepID=A0A6N6JAF1_9RHOB|nr:3-carboxy-cis,cis-muconate cycloisomerase [Litoreibacter roseus]GFE63223.1 3-carboxy-cis,cis-muconate cycloisomerase [Litoreibacter roseus]
MSDIFSHGWLGGLFGDPDMARLLSAEYQLAAMIRVEQVYTTALGEVGQIPKDAARAAADAILVAPIDMKALSDAAARDGIPVPDLVRQIKAHAPEGLHHTIHTGMTTQDVVDTSLVLILKDILDVLDSRLADLIAALEKIRAEYGKLPLMGQTWMQAALPITVADRVSTWVTPLKDHQLRLAEMRPRLLRLSLGGPVGTRAQMGEYGDTIATNMACALEIGNPDKAWHTTRAPIAELASWLSLVSGALGKLGQDVALMAQQGIDAIELRGGGASSAMGHKKNPIVAHLLVALARFNAAQVSGVHQALLHEQERSGAAWMLEWMILPQMLQTTGRSLIAAGELLSHVKRIGDR